MKSTSLSLAFLMLLAVVGQGCTSVKQTTYSTPDAAAGAVIDAARTHDKNALEAIFGPDGQQILSSGDEVADQNMADRFVADYDAKHSLTTNEDGSVTLIVGEQDWPMPIPIVKSEKGAWYFDTAAGKEEILNRRIGRDELNVINVCGAVVDAQREYAHGDHNGDGIPEYAMKFISDPGQKNGLYWKTQEGEAQSPLGPLVGAAVAQGYGKVKTDAGQPTPYHGYYYRMLMSQGPNAPHGAHDYVVNGEMIGGFALVAYPAEYGNSGVMTFMVSQDGMIYQKDLGDQTAKIAMGMTSFDPGPGWQQVQPPEENTAATTQKAE